MTFLYVLTGRDPVPDQHLHADFGDEARRSCGAFGASPWKSLPERFARLVLAMTSDSQADRPDLAQIISELAVLQSALVGGEELVSADIYCEELAARTEFFRGYTFDSDSRVARAPERRGIRVHLRPVTDPREVRLVVEWARTGMEHRKGLNRYVQAAYRKVQDQLKASGWKVEGDLTPGQSLSVGGRRSIGRVADLDEVARRLDEALDNIQFD